MKVLFYLLLIVNLALLGYQIYIHKPEPPKQVLPRPDKGNLVLTSDPPAIEQK